MCHCEPFAFCHSDPVSSTGEESHYFAQDKLREGRYDPRRFAPRNDYFSGSFTIDKGNPIKVPFPLMGEVADAP
jgi:hypothetical protein